MKESLRDFFRVAFAHVRDHLRGEASMEDIGRIAESVLNELTGEFGPVTWSNAVRVSIRDAKHKAMLNRPVRIVGFVTERSDPQLVPIRMPDGNLDDVEGIRVTLEDRLGESVQSLDVLGRHLVDEVQRLARAGGPIEALGAPIALPTVFSAKGVLAERRSFFLNVVDVRPAAGHLDLLGADDSERDAVDGFLRDLTNSGGSPIEWLTDEVIQQLDIVGTDEFPLLRDLLEFVVLQALSCGAVNHSSARLNLLLVGPPAQGKKLVGVAARLLNPAHAELSPSKVSSAGLIGASSRKDGAWTSTPGALVRAAHGVAVLQDAHAWRNSDVAKVGPILQELIEDGVVRSSTAGGITRTAPTALVIDLNRVAQVGISTAEGEAAILRLRPLLSRIDVIAELPEDPERPWTVAEKMLEKLTTKGLDPLDDQPWVRDARLMVAALRDRHPSVDLAPARDMMREAYRRIRRSNADRIGLLLEAGDIPVRMVLSFARLVAARARGMARSVAQPDDVAAVEKFIKMKLRFLNLNASWLGTPAPKASEPRHAWVSRNAQQPVNPADLAKRYQEETGDTVAEKTIRRDLAQLGARKAARGLYYLPPGGGTP